MSDTKAAIPVAQPIPTPNGTIIEGWNDKPVQENPYYKDPTSAVRYWKVVDVTNEHYQSLLKLQQEKQLIGSKSSLKFLRTILKEGYHYSIYNFEAGKSERVIVLRPWVTTWVKKRGKNRRGKERLRIAVTDGDTQTQMLRLKQRIILR